MSPSNRLSSTAPFSLEPPSQLAERDVPAGNHRDDKAGALLGGQKRPRPDDRLVQRHDDQPAPSLTGWQHPMPVQHKPFGPFETDT
ncbi:MAG TPA: hypothetical protein VFC19_07220 [Candidatus Limnocylindrales bacterium]|nr:hypothetical protein [Candidatus Limnocylindrales bacterium]